VNPPIDLNAILEGDRAPLIEAILADPDWARRVVTAALALERFKPDAFPDLSAALYRRKA
jgi:hypothetical protein